MAEQRNTKSDWIWQYYSKLGNRKIRCNICHKNYYIQTRKIRLKVHLFRVHEIFHNEDMGYRNGLIWRYFTEKERYSSKCRICDELLVTGFEVYHLKLHLIGNHPLIVEEIRKEFEHSWVSEYFKLKTSNKLRCKICYNMFDMFKDEVDGLASHLLQHGITKKENIEGNNMNITINPFEKKHK